MAVPQPVSEPRTRPVNPTARSSPSNPSNTTAASQPAAAVSSGLCAACPCCRAMLPATLRRRLRPLLGHVRLSLRVDPRP